MVVRPAAELPTFEQLHAALEYDGESGLFTWKYRPDCPPNWNSRRAEKPAGHVTATGYVSILFNYAGYQAQIMTTGDWAPAPIDHKNMVKTDNRLVNLRLASASQNKINQGLRPDNISGFKGVHWVKRDKRWRACISLNGQKKYLGAFTDAKAAYAVYCEAATQLHGEFARIE